MPKKLDSSEKPKKAAKKKATSKAKKSAKSKDSKEPKTAKETKSTSSSKSKIKPTKVAVQPEINLALVGHVDHGKTTLTERLSGKWTDTHSEELKKGITIRLGYADVEIYHCDKCDYYTTKKKCVKCNSDLKLQRKISLVESHGNESLMATMLPGA